MLTANRRLWSGAMLLALAAAGCDDGRTGLSGPGRAAEGRHIEGRLADVLEIRDGAIALERVPLLDSSFGARIRRGSAIAMGGIVASSRGGRQLRIRSDRVDSVTGARHTIEFERDSEGLPFRTIRASINGARFAEIQREWRMENGVAVLVRERADVHIQGRVLRLDRTVTASQIAAAGLPVQFASLLGGAGSALFAVTPAHAAQACWREAAAYAAASIALAAASQLVLASPEKIAAGLLWLEVWAKWSEALRKLGECMDGNGGLA